jgi:translocation and assembly module TamA
MLSLTTSPPRRIRFWAILLLGLYQHLYAATDTIQIHLGGIEDKQILEQVLASLSLEQQKNQPRLSASRIQRLHKQASEEIQRALQPYGYYRVQVSAKLMPPTAGQTIWQAKYVIDLGPPLKLSAVAIQILGEGGQDPEFQKLLTNLPVKVGDTVNHPNYEKSKSLLREIAEERGYFEAQFTKHQLLIEERAYIASIVLTFDTNQRYRFGEMTFKQDSFEESLLRRFLVFQPGDFYTSSQLLAFQNALTNSDYFDKVAVEMERSSPTSDKRLPITVTVVPRQPNQYSAGIGYGTDTGIRGSVGWERRYVNRQGQRFSAKAELSEIRTSATAIYSLPIGQKSEDYYAISAGYKDETTNTSASELFKLGLHKNHSRKLLDFPLSEMVGIDYRDEKYAVGSDSGHSKLLMPNISWSYLKADDRIYTKRGHKLQLEVRGAVDSLGSNTSFVQSRLSVILIRQLHETGRIIARGEAGYSFVSLLQGDFHDLPPSIRFFAGGDRSVRGYDYQSLGPTNAEGYVIGGKNLLVGSLEYEHQIWDKWSLAAFYDVGNAFNDFSEPLKQGTGLGVRWQSPVGLIRIDVATALSEKGHPWRLHITVGPDL